MRAALVQFPNQRVRVRLFTRVRDRDGVLDVVRRAKEAGAMVVFTLAGLDLRQFFHEAAHEHDVEAVDVIGPLIHKVGTLLGRPPLSPRPRSQPLSEEYFRRVEAIEFAVKSDDGKEPRNLRRADLVLVGREPHQQDAAVDLPRGARSQGRECAAGARRAAARRARGGPPREGGRPHHRPRTAARDPQGAPACSSACRRTPTTGCATTWCEELDYAAPALRGAPAGWWST